MLYTCLLLSTGKYVLLVFRCPKTPENSRFPTNWPISMISPIRSMSGISRITACSMPQGDELIGPRELAAWMSRQRLLAEGTKITAAMFDSALRLRAGIRAYLECNPAQRRKDTEAVRSLNKAMKLFPLVAEARGDRSMTLATSRRDAPGRTVSCRRRALRRFHQWNSGSAEDVRGRRVPTGILRPVEAGDAAMVHVHAVREPNEDQDLSRASSRRRLKVEAALFAAAPRIAPEQSSDIEVIKQTLTIQCFEDACYRSGMLFASSTPRRASANRGSDYDDEGVQKFSCR